jgi:glycosyltransferase involved in cell wall biosynthesis
MASKKVLVITYYWPPAGGPGVQRWLKFVKYLPKFEIEPIVYCPENPSYPITDESLIDEIPNNITVLKQPIREPYGMAKLFSKKSTKTISSGIIPKRRKQSLLQRVMLYIRGNFFIPDARKNWVTPSVQYLSNYITDQNIKTIITTGPPHSLHLIGKALKERLDLKWIADFRDPWTTIGYHKALKLTTTSKAKHVKLESEVLRAADHIIVTSNHTKKEFKTKTKRPITVITNGYDTHKIQIDKKDQLFTMSHIGSLLSNRNPELLWQVLSELIKNNKAFNDAFRLNLIGVVSDDVIESLRSYGLHNHMNITGYINHDEAIRYQMKSQILLLVEINSKDTKAIIPGKLFEYLIAETPILAIGPKDSDVQQIILTTNTGSYFTYDQKELLKVQILEWFKAYQDDSLKINAIGLKPYSRRELTKKLSALI